MMEREYLVKHVRANTIILHVRNVVLYQSVISSVDITHRDSSYGKRPEFWHSAKCCNRYFEKQSILKFKILEYLNYFGAFMSNRAEYLVNNEGGKNHHLISQFKMRKY